MSGRPALRVRCYLGCTRLLDHILAAVHTSFVGFWLGVLRHSDLQELDNLYYCRQDMYRGESYNRGGLFAWEKEAIQRYFSRCRRILVTAAGGGREMLALCRMGYEVDGFECNPVLADYANSLLSEAGYRPAVRACDRDVCPPLAGRYDGAIVGWASFMLIPGRHRRVLFLQELRKALDPEAPILLSFFPLENHRRRVSAASALGNAIRRLRRAELLETGDDLSPNYVHRFTREEVAGTLAAAGFQLAHFDATDYGNAVGMAAGAAAECQAEASTL